MSILKKLAGILILVVLLCSCSANLETDRITMQNDDHSMRENITINFLNWVISEEISAQPLLEVEEVYRRKNNIEIKNSPTSWQDMKYTIYTSLISGDPPDVIQIANAWFGQVYATNALEPLNDYIDNDVLEYYSPDMLDKYTIDGKLYALPWIEISSVVFWNKHVLEKAGISELPVTMEEYKETIKKIGAMDKSVGNIHGFGLPTNEDEITVNLFNVFLESMGTDFLDDNSHVAVDKDKLTELLQWYSELGAQDMIPENMSIKDQYSLFVNNEIAGFVDGLYARNYLRLTSGEGESYDSNIIVTSFPQVYGNSAAYNNDQLLVLTKHSENKEIAADFMIYLCTDSNATSVYYEGSGFAPASPVLLSEDLYINDDIAAVFVENLDNKFDYSIGQTASYYDAIEYIGTGINMVANGIISPEEGSDYIIEKLDILYD